MSSSALDAALAAATARWPGLDVSRAAIERTLADAGVDETRLTARGAEVILAHAAALGDEVATKAFDREGLAPLRGVIHRYTRTAPRTEEVLQRLRIHLLVADGDRRPRAALFDGRGALAAWLGMCATRLALYYLRGERNQREVASEWSDAIAELPAGDPLIEAARERHGATVSAALRDACLALPRRQRALLRLVFIEGASMDDLASVYQVHRVTAWRWVHDAQLALRAQVEDTLRRELGDSFDTTSGLVGWVGDQVELSLSALLAPTATDLDVRAR
jgi:RNA polymerase sigma-70 factor (ECF subfamily)